ncbi:MAG: iron hydrogenase small subunit [Selenomonas sp.]|nr:iron hydrogenase small subunit [Selenomonas sp.]MBQ5501853.1 iron hydrogenase small subunit [Selenomonas sp.]
MAAVSRLTRWERPGRVNSRQSCRGNRRCVMNYSYKEKEVKISRREFLGFAGVIATVLWTGAYAVTDLIVDRTKYIKMRTAGLYQDDEKQAKRQSHHNQSLLNMYKKMDFQPLSHKAEELFHTHYVDRSVL